MRILGISAFYHDSAAALIVDGRIAAAAQEERFTRVKHDARFPVNAIQSCLSSEGISLHDIDHVVFYEKPLPKFERLLETYLAFAPRGFRSFRMALPVWLKGKLFQRSLLEKELRTIDASWNGSLLFAEHHQSHAASAFFPSPFESAAILTMDGVGEWATTSYGIGEGNKINILGEIHFPHSLGLLYSAFTYYTGFRVNSGEYKVMGLAPYGRPIYAKLIRDNLIDVKPDGTFHLNMRYFDYCTGLTMTTAEFHALFGGPPRKPESKLTQRDMDIACSVQTVLEEVVLLLTRSVAKQTKSKNLCLAGGVALNCVANGKILHDGAFERIWIQPASGDAGGALGAALAAYHQHCGVERNSTDSDAMQGSFLGPVFPNETIQAQLRSVNAVFHQLSEEELIDQCAEALSHQMAVGWFQGRMEFGPRALGNRSILADPRSPDTQRALNLKIKFRESFRPFAPSVTRESVDDWFMLNQDSPYMLLVADVKPDRRIAVSPSSAELFGIDLLHVPRSTIPAVTHVDGSARVQTVDERINPRFHKLLKAFEARTGCPVLVNTSFNVRGEPIVATPLDAFRCFMATDLDVLAIGDILLRKQDQPEAAKKQYHKAFDLD